MSGFLPKQVRALRRGLDRNKVQTREFDGRTIDYIEGWFAIAEANSIFGFDGWDREMTHFERLYERTRNDRTSCGFLARVRVRVRTSDSITTREGTGWGHAHAPSVSDAYERAVKMAETDATKRALATFGNRFGLSLYDKAKTGSKKKSSAPASLFAVFAPDGSAIARDLSAEAFCNGLRQLIEYAKTAPELEALSKLNGPTLSRLKIDVPQLKIKRGPHHADALENLIKERLIEVSSAAEGASSPSRSLLKPSKIGAEIRIDKSTLAISTERRLRDPLHLKFVAQNPCLVCGRQPSNAHHLRFAQTRGVALKVSDEFSVPLCSSHHDELHRSGSEKAWWTRYGIDPLPIAAALWNHTRSSDAAPPGAHMNGADRT